MYPSSAYLNLCFLFFGAFLGSLLCIVFGKAFKKRFYKFRLSLCFLLLSAAVVFLVLFLISRDAQIVQEKSDFGTRIFALFLYCVFGGMCAAFLKTVLPVAAFLYVVFTFCFGAALYKRLPQKKNASFTVSESFLRDESTGKEYKFKKSQSEKNEGDAEKTKSEGGVLCVAFFLVYELNENSLFPLPHIWHEMGGAILPNAGMLPKDFSEQSVFAFKKHGGFFSGVFYSACNSILGRPRIELLEIPLQQIYPSLYNAKFICEGSAFRVGLERIM